MTRLVDLRGKVFGQLTVLDRAETSRGHTQWLCSCACGAARAVSTTNLTTGHTKSCGCLHRDHLREYVKTHGPSRKYQDPTIATRNSVIAAYRNGAKHRGLTWALTAAECVELFAAPCRYCGAPPSNVRKVCGGNAQTAHPYTYNGIDRVVSHLGYVPGNVVACCITCNRAKSDMTLADFLAWLTCVYNHLCR